MGSVGLLVRGLFETFVWALVQDFNFLVQASYYMFYVKLIFKCYYSTYLLLFFVKLMYFFFKFQMAPLKKILNKHWHVKWLMIIGGDLEIMSMLEMLL